VIKSKLTGNSVLSLMSMVNIIGQQYNVQEDNRKENNGQFLRVAVCDSALQLPSLHVVWVAFNQQWVG
jgi:hypothetical protein